MRIVTALSMVAGSILATMAATKMWDHQTQQIGLDVKPVSADFLLVKDHAGWPANMERMPLSVKGNWRIECDGSLFDYRDITLGAATDRAHDLGCEAWEVSAIDGLSWN